jgi:uncharacterized protein YggU (UPF0235/DUF167 family)
MITLTAHERGTVLPVRAQPGAKKSAVLGERAGALRVAVSAAPERGKANEAIQVLLAEALGIRTSRVALLSGQTSREKRFLILDLTPGELHSLVAQWCEE